MKGLKQFVCMLVIVLLLSSCGAKSNVANEIATETLETSEENLRGDKWAKEYLDCVERYFCDYIANETSRSAHLIDVNGDDIPELYMNGDGVSTGGIIYSYDTTAGELFSQQLYNYGFSYIPGENLFLDSGGRMDSYYDYVYSIENGQFVKKYAGEYDSYTGDFKYFWEGEELNTEKEYWDKLKQVCDYDRLVKPFEKGTEYPQICFELSKRIENEYNGELILTEENIAFLTECALRLSYCEGKIGSEAFAESFVYNYYVGRPKENMVYDEYGNICWTKSEIRNDYKLLFGEDMPSFTMDDKGEFWVWSEDLGELGYSDFYFGGIEEKVNEQFVINFGQLSSDFGTMEDVNLVIEKFDNSNGFIIKSIKKVIDEESETEKGYDKILNGDFSFVAGVYEYPDGNTFELLSDGLYGDVPSWEGYEARVEDIKKLSDGSYSWSIGDYENGECFGGVACMLYPIGVEVVAYNGKILDTDTSKIRYWSGQDVVFSEEYIAHKTDNVFDEEKYKKLVVEYFAKTYPADGDYVVFDSETIKDDKSYIMTIRFQPNYETMEANQLVEMVEVEKTTAEMFINDKFVCNLKDLSK